MNADTGPTPTALAMAYTAARAAVSVVPTWRLRRVERAWRRRAAGRELDLAARVVWASARAELRARGRRVPAYDTPPRRWPRHR